MKLSKKGLQLETLDFRPKKKSILFLVSMFVENRRGDAAFFFFIYIYIFYSIVNIRELKICDAARSTTWPSKY